MDSNYDGPPSNHEQIMQCHRDHYAMQKSIRDMISKAITAIYVVGGLVAAAIYMH